MQAKAPIATQFKAGFFTLGDIIIFSYKDGLSVSIYNSTGTLLTTQSLNKGDHYFYHADTLGVYYTVGNQAYSVLVGDPVTLSVMGYFAANDSYYGVAKEFYTYVSSDQDVITFAYNTGTTNVNVESWTGSAWSALSAFSLTGPGDHYLNSSWKSSWLHFTSDQPISVECYSDRCFSVPAETGLWAGTHFYLFAGWYDVGDNIHVHSYKANTNVTVKYIGGSIIWTGMLNDGDWENIDSGLIGKSQYVEVVSNDTVTVTDEPYWASDYFGFLAVPDQSGTGVGTKFYTYARESPSSGVGDIWVFSYGNNTDVTIKDMTGGTTAWTGVLEANEYYQFTPSSGAGGHLFGIFSNNVVSAVEGSGYNCGAAFVPLYSAAEIILPKVIIDSPTDGEIFNVGDVTMAYHSPDQNIAYFEVRIDSGVWINNSLLTTYHFTGLSDGSHVLEVRATNDLGITGISAQVTIEVKRAHQAYMVVKGMDCRIYYRAWNGTYWGNWMVLPGSTCDSPAAALVGNTLHIVVRGSDGCTLWHGYLTNPADPSSFSGWKLLCGTTQSAPTLTSNGTTLCLVVRGLDNRVYYCCYDSSWGSWRAIPSGVTCASPAAAMIGNQLHIVVQSTCGCTLWHGFLSNLGDPSSFSGWTLLTGATSSAPTLTSNNTALCLVVRGLDNRVYDCCFSGASWWSWHAVPTGATGDRPGAMLLGNELHIVVRGMDCTGALWHEYVELPTDTYSNWNLLSGASPSAPTLTG